MPQPETWNDAGRVMALPESLISGDENNALTTGDDEKLFVPPGGGGGGSGVSSVNNRTGDVTLDKTDVGLGNVNDTADMDKPVSTAQQAAIDAEAQRAQQAESALAQAITDEANSRQSADAALQNGIQTETSDRQTAVANGVNEAKAYADSLFAGVNTAEFAGPYADVPSIPTPYDTNDLYLVGDAEPYDIYAYVQGQLKRIGSSNVDLSGYYDKTEIDSALGLKMNNPAPSGQSMDGNIPTLNANGDGLVNSGKKITDFATAAQGTKADNAATAANLNAHTGNGDIHVTAAQKTAWTAKQDALTFPIPVTQGGTGLQTIPRYSLLAATDANALKPYKRGSLGVISQVSFARPYKQFTNTINRPGFDNMGDVGKAQVEFIGQMKLYTDGTTESVAGKIKIRWAELVFSAGGNIDLSGQVILSPTALIKSFFPAICDNNVGYNNPTLVNEGAEGVCGKITACNHNGVKYNIYGGALLQYDSTNGLTAVGTIVTTDVATLMYEMEFPIAAMWTSAESTFWGDIP